jgi:hypothetical protein
MQLHVAGAFEFFENPFIHPAAGLDQRGRENCQAAAFFNIPRRAEKFLRLGDAFASTPPDMIRPLPGCKLLYPRESRVMPSKPHVLFQFRKRLARSSTISATCTCR